MNTKIQIKTNVIGNSELFYPELSYKVVGILFSAHNELGPWSKEKQYADVIGRKFREIGISFRRECRIGNSGNIVDFIIEDCIILEFKAKRLILRDDYEQTQRYLQETQLKLALLVNFRSKYLKPIRVVKIDLT
jgi:GxxExxY protein